MTRIVRIASKSPDDPRLGHHSYWLIQDGSAKRYDRDDSEVVSISSVQDLARQLQEGVLKLEDRQHFGHIQVNCQEAEADAGNYFPRIYRPSYEADWAESPDGTPIDSRHLGDSLRRFRILWRELDDIFEYLYPSEGNMGAYGDKIRNLIMLCAMEIEAHFRGVLIANAYPAREMRMRDYQKLEEYMALSEYRLAFQACPLLGDRTPFENFSVETPGWWRAYNKIKHDRDANLDQGTLEHAIDAFCAVAVVLLAQYGRLRIRMEESAPLLNTIFSRMKLPSYGSRFWQYFPLKGSTWQPAPLFQ